MPEGDIDESVLNERHSARVGPLTAWQPRNPVPDAEMWEKTVNSPETKQRAEAKLAQNRLKQPSDENLRSYFHEQYDSHSQWRLARTEEDGSQTEIRAFEFYIDPTNPKEVRGVLVDFGLRAAQVGFAQSLGPLVLPGSGVAGERDERRSLTAVYFFLERQQ